MSVIRDLAYGVAAIGASPVWAYKMLRTGKHRTDWRGRFGHCDAEPDARKTLLIHAVSVGEVNATTTLVEALRQRYGDELRVAISTTTDTGFARATALYDGRCPVVRFPFDFSWMVHRFIEALRPDAVLLMELEVWPGFMDACVKRHIPVAVVNGRLSARSYRGYRRFRAILGPMFRKLTAACVQDEAYAHRFRGMGVPDDRLRITGTMKWDTAELADTVEGADALAAAMGIDRAQPLVVCGSSGPGEEALFIEQLADLTDAQGRPVQLLIAPRKPERFNEAAAAMGEPVRRSRCPDGSRRDPDGRRLFLLDSMGDLRKAYALSGVAVVGRSFCPLYGSDMMEPVALGKPTVVGPNTSDFADTMAKLLAGDGVVQVADGPALRRAVGGLLGAERGAALAARGRDVIRAQRGATEKHVELAVSLLNLSR